MKQQKLVQVCLDGLHFNQCVELAIQKYLQDGWVIVSYQVCLRGDGYHGDVVILLEK